MRAEQRLCIHADVAKGHQNNIYEVVMAAAHVGFGLHSQQVRSKRRMDTQNSSNLDDYTMYSGIITVHIIVHSCQHLGLI